MALLRYTLLRLALLGLVAGILYLLGVRSFWLLLLAFLISGGISLFVLSSARDDVSRALSARNQTIHQRLEERGGDEPADVGPSAQDEPADVRPSTQDES
jgi:membrane protein implicated in regulation of membrane protease activity